MNKTNHPQMALTMKRMRSDLDLIHGSDVHGLDEVLELAHLLLQLINGDLGILDNAHQLKLLDSVPIGTSLLAPQRRPSISMVLQFLSISSMSVSSSQVLTSKRTEELAIRAALLDFFLV